MSADPVLRARREPPAFRPLSVVSAEARTPHLVRVTLRGDWLFEFEAPLPGGSVRLLLPPRPGAELVMPVWDGNAFFHTDGRRPLVRTLTPLRHDPDAGELDVEAVLHGEAPLSRWADGARPGDRVALSGPGRGYAFKDGVAAYLIAGDESALPAIGQLLDALPAGVPATVIVEVAHPDARLPLTDRQDVDVRWVDRPAGGAPGAALVPAVVAADIEAWHARCGSPARRRRCSASAGTCSRTAGCARADATVRGYWKDGSASIGDDE